MDPHSFWARIVDLDGVAGLIWLGRAVLRLVTDGFLPSKVNSPSSAEAVGRWRLGRERVETGPGEASEFLVRLASAETCWKSTGSVKSTGKIASIALFVCTLQCNVTLIAQR